MIFDCVVCVFGLQLRACALIFARARCEQTKAGYNFVEFGAPALLLIVEKAASVRQTADFDVGLPQLEQHFLGQFLNSMLREREFQICVCQCFNASKDLLLEAKFKNLKREPMATASHWRKEKRDALGTGHWHCWHTQI